LAGVDFFAMGFKGFWLIVNAPLLHLPIQQLHPLPFLE
jgi:heme exporter protein D